jgi:hypothetical protein
LAADLAIARSQTLEGRATKSSPGAQEAIIWSP